MLRKLDQKGKTNCGCTVEAGGYRYKDNVYGSLSGAAVPAGRGLLFGSAFTRKRVVGY